MNKNLYSRYFTPTERQGLKKLSFDDLTPEIKLFRILLMRQLEVEHAQDTPLSLKNRLAGLRALSYTTATLSTLIQTQQIYHNLPNKFEESIIQAIKELDSELNYKRKKSNG